jgi:hypothetical protein
MENDESHEQPAAATTASAASAETGRDDTGSQGERPVQGDSPLAADRAGAVAPEAAQDPNSADWRYLYSMVHDRFEAERGRGRALDQKIGVLLAGAIAAMAFTYANGPQGWWSLGLLVFLGPLTFLLAAFKTRRGKDAPTIESLANAFPYYPNTTLRSAITAMVEAENFDRHLHDRKAARSDLAIAALGLAFVLVLLLQVAWRVTAAA